MLFIKMIMPIAIMAASTPTASLRGTEVSTPALSPEHMQKAALSDAIVQSSADHANIPRDAVHRCHQSVAEFGPAPSVDDCNGAIKKLQAVQGDITVNLVEGCYHAVSGNCTASVCPQRVGISTISPTLAAQYMTNSILTECIADGLRGWYLDRSYGIGVYLT
ncbi:uncharacterized protein F4822DRAFT_442317 [Hypoxylon trugodes]|uniref:uncharacterized protein n=1 Tax=Hypoxylon trugodes TaxID=326681 RepID=UPI00219B4AF4|nr:uncharacterized protein F4822DRAFT_442317 [Hypoxylon trugodes]KAI1391254.1 hypothetical protein F4822DRAFT_442317 [Hypoxylon trugodes]